VKYVMTFQSGRGAVQLDQDASCESVAAECREAALAFMSGVARGWGKTDLALWLTGPYADATRHVKRGERVSSPSDHEELSEESIEELMTRVRGHVLAALEKAALEIGEPEFTAETVERGFVRRAVDADGMTGWVPVDGARMRLRDRLRSLFVADFLAAPEVYADLLVCHRCEAVVFDAAQKSLGVCGSHRISGMVPRGENEGAPDSASSRLAAVGDHEPGSR